MTWTQQRQRVNSLSNRAQEKRREARRFRGNLKGWMSSYLGSVETLAWLFAAGSFWAAGRSSVVAGGIARRSVVTAVNTSVLAWHMLHRQLKFVQSVVGNPADEQR